MNYIDLYNTMPVFIQNQLVSLEGYRLKKKRTGKLFEEYLTLCAESDSWDEHKIKGYKEEQIARVLEQAYKNVPFYKKSFDSVGISFRDFKQLEDISKFPILTKDDIRKYGKELLATNCNAKNLTTLHTGGSTGTPLTIYQTSNNVQLIQACVWNGRQRHGVNPGDCHIHFCGGHLVCPLSTNKPPYWRYNKALNQYRLNVQHITPEKTPDIVDFINNVQPVYLAGYPSGVYVFAKYAEEQGLSITASPKCLFCSSEKLYDYQRAVISKVFPNMKLLPYYGFSEGSGSASSCEKNIYHEDFLVGHMELLDPHNDNGELTGSVLSTGFANDAMPLIRYKVGDVASFLTTGCDCGLKSQAIKDIEGRVEDYIITPEGLRIKRMSLILHSDLPIVESQVIQNRVDEIKMLIVPTSQYSPLIEEKIRHNIHTTISPTLKVSFEYVKEIPRTANGKFRAVISLIDKTGGGILLVISNLRRYYINAQFNYYLSGYSTLSVESPKKIAA